MKKAIFVVGLEGLRVSEDLGRGDKLFGDAFITNNREPLRGFLGYPNATLMLGTSEMEFLCKCGTLVYLKTDVDDGEDPHERLADFMYQVGMFLHSMWFFYDCAVNQDNIHLFVWGESGADDAYHSNIMRDYLFSSRGERNEILLSRSELKTVRQFLRDNFDLKFLMQKRERKNRLFSHPSRFGRAMYYVQMARGHSDSEIRLSLLISALETMFVDTSGEVSHSLAERTSKYLFSTLEERTDCYLTLKRAYNVRSKVFHGDTLKESKFSEVDQLCIETEDILRKALFSIATSVEARQLFSSPNEKFSAAMREMVLR